MSLMAATGGGQPQARPQALDLPRLTRADLRWRNALARHGHPLDLTLAERRHRVWLTPAPVTRDASPAPWHDEPCIRRALYWRDTWCELHTPVAQGAHWLRCRFPDPPLPPIPDAYARSAAQALSDDFLAALTAFGCDPLSPAVSDAPAPMPASGLQWVSLFLQCAEEPPWSAWFRTTRAGLAALAEHLGARGPHLDFARLQRIPLSMRLSIGETALPRAELAELAAGDLLLMDRRADDGDGGIWLTSGRWGLKATFSEQGLRVEQAFSYLGDMMTPVRDPIDDDEEDSTFGEEFDDFLDEEDDELDDDEGDTQSAAAPTREHLQHEPGALTAGLAPAALQAAAAASASPEPVADDSAADASDLLDDIETQVSFDLGDTTLSFGVIARLQEGEVIELQTPIDSAVRVRVNGHLIAYGELVAVDGRMAVAITRMKTARTPLAS